MRRDHTGDTSYSYPVVRFNLPDGRTVEAAAVQGAAPGVGSEGDQVNLLYDPENPTDIRIAGFLGSGQMGGIVMIIIGVLFFLHGRRASARSSCSSDEALRDPARAPLAFVPLIGRGRDRRLRRSPFDFAWWFAVGRRRRSRRCLETWRATLVLRVDAEGVRIGQRPNRRIPQPFVPWTSIQEVALTETDPPEIAVRLKQGAPLPAGRGRGDPRSGPTLRSPHRGCGCPLPGADRSALAAAVEGFGGVPLRSA